MNIKYFEYIAIYLSVLLVCIFLGAVVRFVLIDAGIDEYTAGVFFWISTGIGILLFAILSLFISNLADRLLNHFLKAKKNESPKSQIPVEGFEKIKEQQDTLIKAELSENKNPAKNSPENKS
ncbi:hypothetical protein [Flavobacterium tistrianum]|uniref:hypothetical protein n=1 Tax=Flavobacterium tistrianum TaxID=1685414 RepID=UPI000DAF0492|nr:hypothetical protein [Flavobacterium tistrianum]KAF2342959.1 DHHC zinc finger domain-containing protein [Flavobacterium tistrianum]